MFFSLTKVAWLTYQITKNRSYQKAGLHLKLLIKRSDQVICELLQKRCKSDFVFSAQSLDNDHLLTSFFSSIHMKQLMNEHLISVQFGEGVILRQARDQRPSPCYRHARQASFRVDLALLWGMRSPLQADYWLILVPQRPTDETNYIKSESLQNRKISDNDQTRFELV